MIVAAANSGVDILGVLGLILGVGTVIIPLLIFANKALIHKTVSPIKEKQSQQDTKMQLLESEICTIKESHDKIIAKLEDLPNTIIKALKEREEIYDLKYELKK